MIDIHTHILPELDDGSGSLFDSLEMAELAVESGVHTIVATPHCNMEGIFDNYYHDEWMKHIEHLKAFLEERGSRVRILPGMEIFSTSDVAEKIKEKILIPLNHSRYYLMEFPFDANPFWMGDVLESVLHLDKVPVIAHPERYYCVQDNPMLLYEWMKQGCLSQLNKGSIFGRFGRHAQMTAEILLHYGLVTCVASDAHSPIRRTTFMGDIKDFLTEEYGKKHALELLFLNPERIISDKEISNDYIMRPEISRWFI